MPGGLGKVHGVVHGAATMLTCHGSIADYTGTGHQSATGELMQIAHVITSLDPAAGGPPMVVMRLAAAQASLGHDVSVICYDVPEAADAIDRSYKDIPHIGRVAIRNLEPGGSPERVLGLGMGRKLRPMIAACDWVQLHGVWETMLRVASSVARGLGKPYVVMPHGMLDAWCMSQKRVKKQIAMLLAYRRMLEHAAYLHVLNRDEEASIQQLGLTAPTRVIPNGVYVEEIEPLPEPGGFREAHPDLGDAPYVLFLSRLHHKKGLDYLAEAFSIMARSDASVRLVVAGPDEGARDPFEQAVASADLTERVHLVGPIYGSAKYQALVDAACFCLPSRQEGFSIAITEALACGTPVVISEACHFPEVAEAEAGCVLPLDAQRFADAMLELIGQGEGHTEMGDNARRLVKQRYTWQKIAEQSIACYRDVSGER